MNSYEGISLESLNAMRVRSFIDYNYCKARFDVKKIFIQFKIVFCFCLLFEFLY